MEASLLAEKIAEIDKDVVHVRADVSRLEGESRAYYKEAVRVIQLEQRLRTPGLTATQPRGGESSTSSD